MDARLTALLARLLDPGSAVPSLPVLDTGRWLTEDVEAAARVATAFLVAASGPAHPHHELATTILARPPSEGTELATFYLDGLERIEDELQSTFAKDPQVASRWDAAAAELASARTADEVAEAAWRAFCPQAVGLRGHEPARIAELRRERTVEVERLVDDPISDPSREVLFTSNVMLTTPDASTDIAALPYPADLRDAIAAAADERQRYWFDHPIQIGVDPAANELLYGLRGLDAAIAAEPTPGRTTLLLSVSFTHDGLAPIARRYLAAELAREGRLRHLEVIIVTEEDTRRLIEEVLLPALGPAGEAAAAGLHRVVGVDGHYGRHYSFLKAVAGLWQVAIDPDVRATFKIDLDQVFPQAALLAKTGKTMFGHLCTPLWGARARDADGHELWLGMLAGALVNERDIDHGLFTPDVPIPESRPMLDEHVFFSALPQAISTRAEMMERYQGSERDGLSRALQRVHVTGGTSGIRVDALRACRPFTPSWVGRAEDQAYLLSVIGRPGPRLAYAHAAGLVMRHDKEIFAGQSMAAARIGKLIGDDVRILVFSAYVAALEGSAADAGRVRRLLDPFSGCFASATPQTVVFLRVALRTLHLYAQGDVRGAREYAVVAARRVPEALVAEGDLAITARELERERAAWNDYYAALDALETGRPDLRARAAAIIDTCRVASA